ncbi:hypothetical protein ACIBG0_12180 [Nocardia sp. NPDC050630]
MVGSCGGFLRIGIDGSPRCDRCAQRIE